MGVLKQVNMLIQHSVLFSVPNIRACSTTDVHLQLHSNKDFFLLFLQRRKEVEFRHGLRAV